MNRREFFAAGAGLAATALATPALARRSASIVDLAVATPELSTLVAAVQAGGLVDTLNGDGPFTVFAPTNAAFAALPAGTLDSLLQPANKGKLVDILTYHVAGAYYPARSIIGQRGRIPTVQGKFLHANGQGNGVVLNRKISVTTADIMASNGVVHIIDGVLLP
ncbi:fasciclin domain-containing protein [Rhodovulum adriaticum]|uniref:Putative surface protein with fasciclin (FAS1) repeats n=1 Tax=Rhodovulum adriaticum TaxID=35804 RepID=A0A4R2NZL2_RHOAD|nr:fasciclin domain-containing protein [Rhodovulum adriaticum]MBK1637218.1 fasciclin [Rhodovulum adriaticum]TCP27104.1 putative surface protein with fasciclin (FAS1) repeats [Rhodovulum adriaticum]